jgi:hypothetical protein
MHMCHLFTAKENCSDPAQPGKGYWISEDRFYGYGLNVPRTRHASEIIRTQVQIFSFFSLTKQSRK